MISRRSILLISGGISGSGTCGGRGRFGHDPIKMFDTDADGTLDLPR